MASHPPGGAWLTFFQYKSARVIEEEVSEVVAVGIDARLFAQTGRPEEGEGLQRAQSRLAFGYCHGAASNWNKRKKK